MNFTGQCEEPITNTGRCEGKVSDREEIGKCGVTGRCETTKKLSIIRD